jgi:hypothetical protein
LLLIRTPKRQRRSTVFRGHSSKLDTKSGYSLSEDALRALQSGDTQALIDSHRDRFAGYKMMADDDGDDDDDDSGDDDKKGKKGSGDSGDGDDDDDDDAGSDGDDDDDDKDADDKLSKLEKRMKAADQRAAKAEKKLQDIEDAKKDDLTKATDRVTQLESEAEEKDSTINGLRLQIGFLSTNKHTWHKPGAALKLAQSEGYLDEVLSDDGTVDSKKMGSALDKLAKEHAYLVKTGGSGSSGESGSGRSGNGKDDKAQVEADRRRAPALSRRR